MSDRSAPDLQRFFSSPPWLDSAHVNLINSSLDVSFLFHTHLYKSNNCSQNNNILIANSLLILSISLSILRTVGMTSIFSNSPVGKYVLAIKNSPPSLYNWRLILTVIMYALSGMPKGTVATTLSFQLEVWLIPYFRLGRRYYRFFDPT
jgi:hypothetical protein